MRFSPFAAVLGAVLSLGSVCDAQLPVTTHSLSLDATVANSGGASKSGSGLTVSGQAAVGGGTVTNNDYSQQRSKESGIGLAVQVRNLGRTPDNARLEWYFVANPVAKGEKYIFDSGSQDIALPAASFEKYNLQSKELASQVIKQLHVTDGVNALGQSIAPTASVRKTGATVGGWIVRLMVDGKPYQVRASSPSLETVARNETALATFRRGGP